MLSLSFWVTLCPKCTPRPPDEQRRCSSCQYKMFLKHKSQLHTTIFSKCKFPCNWFYTGMSFSLTQKRQWVQNSAAGLAFGRIPKGYITPVLKALHWHLVYFHVKCKCCLWVLWSPIYDWVGISGENASFYIVSFSSFTEIIWGHLPWVAMGLTSVIQN